MRKFSALAFMCGVALALAPGARADNIFIGLSTGGPITTIASGTGVAGVVGLTFGNYVVNNISSTGFPFLPQPTLHTSSINTSTTAGGILKVYITQTDLTSSLNPFVSGFTLNNLFGTGSVAMETRISTTNALYSGALLASRTFTGINSDSSTDFFAGLTSPFSETAVYTINLGASTTTSSADSTITLTAVPEPTSMLLFGSGFSGLAMLLRRRKAAAAAAAAAEGA